MLSALPTYLCVSLTLTDSLSEHQRGKTAVAQGFSLAVERALALPSSQQEILGKIPPKRHLLSPGPFTVARGRDIRENDSFPFELGEDGAPP